MKQINKYLIAGCFLVLFSLSSCVPSMKLRTENKIVPNTFAHSVDSANSAILKWDAFFTDSNLIALVDTALRNNQELNIMMQEINIANNEVRASKGEYLPSVNFGAGAGIEKVGKYTSQGQSDMHHEYEEG